MWLAGRLPADLWLACCFGRALPPAVIGRLIAHVVEELLPRDPILPPDELFPYPGMRDFNEWSLYRGWMRQYLNRTYGQPLNEVIATATDIAFPGQETTLDQVRAAVKPTTRRGRSAKR